jgi:hypothetical protein
MLGTYPYYLLWDAEQRISAVLVRYAQRTGEFDPCGCSRRLGCHRARPPQSATVRAPLDAAAGSPSCRAAAAGGRRCRPPPPLAWHACMPACTAPIWPSQRPAYPCCPPPAAWMLNTATQVELSVDMFLLVASVVNVLCIHGMTSDKMQQQKERKAAKEVKAK